MIVVIVCLCVIVFPILKLAHPESSIRDEIGDAALVASPHFTFIPLSSALCRALANYANDSANSI